MGIKKFVITSLKFLIAVILVCVLSFLFNSAYVNIRGYEIEPHQNILILGDSHTEYAVDDTIFTNSVNLSHSADSYFYSYLKVKRMKQENPQIDTLLLAFSNHNLLSQYDERWLLNPLHIKSKFRIYTDLMSFSDFGFFLKSKPMPVLQGIMEMPKYSIKLLLKGGIKERDLGSFKPSERNKLAENIERFKKDSNKRTLKYSEIEKSNFFNIINFCKKNDITVILVSTPIHKVYLSNEDKMKEFELLYSFYDSKLNGVTFLDYSFYNIPDSCYQDINHLNRKGAQKFTEQLINDIRSNSYTSAIDK
ncbi:hypothetical protein FVB32_15530 [Flagellimonas hymeniacidonis]|uniref:SGNH/GDSL hydrolase family protein n=1 Tax=Flagellimonas hymeniacidonis TaxID=2603628 RepID=A0A5C8V328_9FLAO|nr:hypothetical protein [Flagellimonas hymeniacidonis]TXN35970.1 hypothetical protein FVB32_15530 [Flagellimonas hymeniacidonis]